jgi:multicomponent Na+:H+ antiporter subunit F
VNLWLAAALGMVLALAPCGIVCFKGGTISRLVGLEMADTICVLLLILLAEGFHRLPFYDLAVALALLAFGGGLVFVRFLERYL